MKNKLIFSTLFALSISSALAAETTQDKQDSGAKALGWVFVVDKNPMKL